MSNEQNDCPQYEDGIVAYVDILGFSKYICDNPDIKYTVGWFKLMDNFRTSAQIVPPRIQGIPENEMRSSPVENTNGVQLGQFCCYKSK